MRITADANVLVRPITRDDERQSEVAQKELLNADSVALSLTALCELVGCFREDIMLRRLKSRRRSAA